MSPTEKDICIDEQTTLVYSCYIILGDSLKSSKLIARFLEYGTFNVTLAIIFKYLSILNMKSFNL